MTEAVTTRSEITQQRSRSGVPLLNVLPDLATRLDAEEVERAGRVQLPASDLARGTDVGQALDRRGAFGAIVVDGLLLQSVQIQERPSLTLLGAAALVPFTSAQGTPLANLRVLALKASRVALLDDRFLFATHRWPQIVVLMYAQAVEQSDRLSAQLAISHLPRVEDRVMAIMWLLADQWGHVTSAGVRLPLSVTHDALGELVGAQRPTITIALKELAERGSLIRQDDDWLLLDPVPEPHSGGEPQPSRVLHDFRPGSTWKAGPEASQPKGRLAHLRAELSRLRKQYAPDKQLAHELQDEARALRGRAHELLDDIRVFSKPDPGEPPPAPAERNPGSAGVTG
jgi:CRP/FNR family transcriptional regulator, cyclic AMP receptor protein